MEQIQSRIKIIINNFFFPLNLKKKYLAIKSLTNSPK